MKSRHSSTITPLCNTLSYGLLFRIFSVMWTRLPVYVTELWLYLTRRNQSFANRPLFKKTPLLSCRKKKKIANTALVCSAFKAPLVESGSVQIKWLFLFHGTVRWPSRCSWTVRQFFIANTRCQGCQTEHGEWHEELLPCQRVVDTLWPKHIEPVAK